MKNLSDIFSMEDIVSYLDFCRKRIRREPEEKCRVLSSAVIYGGRNIDKLRKFLGRFDAMRITTGAKRIFLKNRGRVFTECGGPSFGREYELPLVFLHLLTADGFDESTEYTLRKMGVAV